MSDALFMLLDVFNGSDGELTTQLYARLERFGPIGIIGLNLFRAQKNSARAKVYRGGNQNGSYRQQAYARKEWAIGNLTTALTAHGDALGLRWGWKLDPNAESIPWVLYVDLPLHDGLKQASFHTPTRGTGPDYVGDWDGIPDQSTTRILRFISEQILATVPA
jgi:hypothetical protein